MGKIISTAKARKIASDWHGGQWSALYQFASSGVFVPENYSRYSNEINAEIERETEYHSRITKKQSNELWQLRKYFEYKRNENVMKNIASIGGRKKIYETVYVIQGNYGSKWEDVTYESTWKDAKQMLKDYDANERYPHRIIQRKERIKEKPVQHQYVPGSYYAGKGIYHGVQNNSGHRFENWLKFTRTDADERLYQSDDNYNYEPNYQGIHGIGDDINPKKPLGWYTFIKNTIIRQDNVSPQPKLYKAGTFVWGLKLWGKDNSILMFQDTPESKQKYSTTLNTVKPGKLKRAIMNRRSSSPVSPAASPAASPAGRGSKVKSWFAKRPVLKKVAKAAIILSPTALTALAAKKVVQKIKSRKAHMVRGGIMTIASTNPDNAIM